MFSVEGLPILDAISYIKDKLDILDKEIRLLKPPGGEIPLTMSLAFDLKMKLQEELASLEKKASEILKELGPLNSSNMALLEFYSVQYQQVTLPDSKELLLNVAGLLYTNSGDAILALGSKGSLRMWKWSGKASASVTPQQWLPKSGFLMENEVRENHEETVSCLVLSQNDGFILSTCGVTVSLFRTDNFRKLATLESASTSLALDPLDNNIVAVGMHDSSINIYNFQTQEVKSKLEGHQKHITGLAFSTKLKVLVSSGADAQLFFWDSVSWVKKSSLPLELPMAKTQGCKTRSATGKAPEGNTGVQFHKDQIHLLVSHETHLSIYDASKMERIHQWLPQGHLSCLTSASYSGNNSELVYALFANGRIGIFEAKSLIFKCHIDPAVYVSQPTPNSERIIAQVIVGNPKNRGLVAVGFSDGSVIVIEQSVA